MLQLLGTHSRWCEIPEAARTGPGLERESAAEGGPCAQGRGVEAALLPCPHSGAPFFVSDRNACPQYCRWGVRGSVRCQSETPAWKGKEGRAHSPHNLFGKQPREKEWEKETSLALPF